MDGLKARAMIITPFLQSLRGNSLTAARLKKGLEELGADVTIISLKEKAWRAKLEKMVLDNDLKLIHGFHGMYFGRVLQEYPVLKKKPLVLTFTGTDLNRQKNEDSRSLLREVLKNVDRAVVFNDEFKYQLANACLESMAKLATIPQGVVLEEGIVTDRSDIVIAEEDLVFLLPSGLRERKNIDMALDALEIAHRLFPRIRLLIIGTTIEKKYSERIHERLKKLPWARYLGEIPHESMKGMLELGDVVLNTSGAEGQPQGALEAMSLGRPAILTAVPGDLGVMTHGVEGFYVHDEEDLAIAACNLIGDRNMRERMGKAARVLVERKFSYEAEKTAYAQLYQELLSQAASR